MNREVELLEGQIRECYGRVVYSHKTHEKCADILLRRSGRIKMAQIALSEGLTFEQFRTLMVNVRNQAIDQAVLSGALTQVQADWMKLYGAGQTAGGYAGKGMYGMNQAGQGQYLNQDCPFTTQSIP